MKNSVRAQKVDFGAQVDLYLISEDHQSRSIGTAVTMAPLDGGFYEPTFSINRDQAQQLMDDLWDAGLRPTEGSGSAGSLAATERHLADMRRIAFKHINEAADACTTAK